MDKDFKEEIKLLKEKLKKKNKRVIELSKYNKNIKIDRDYWFQEYKKIKGKYYTIKKYFPEKYYRVEWSGVNIHGNRLSPKTELKKGICAAEIISDLENNYRDSKIHMIEEVAS